MPRKSYKRLADERKKRQDYLWETIKKHPDFQYFQKDHQALIDCLQIQDIENLVRLARKNGLYPRQKMAAIVIPYRRARIVDGKLDISPHLKRGRFLLLKLNLAESLTILRPSIEFQIRRYKHLVEQRPQRVRHPAVNASRFRPRLKGKWLHIELDLFQQVDFLLNLVETALSEFRNRVQTRNRRRGIAIDESDLELYDRVQSGESPYAIGREASEYSEDDWNADLQESRRQKARRAVRKIKKLSE